MPSLSPGDSHEIPCIFGIDRYRLFNQNVSAGGERRASVFVMEGGRTRNDADIDLGVENLLIALGGKLEAKSVADLLEKLRALSADSNELEFIPAGFEGRQVRCHDPRARADHADPQAAHDALR